MEFSTAQTQLKSTERVLRRRSVTREHHCVPLESRAEAGAVLRHRRVDDLDMTQQALADLAGVGLSSVKRLESGKRLERKIERKVSRALGWTEGSIDLVFAGRAPTPDQVESAERAWADDFVAEVRAMTHEQMARRAGWVARVTRSQAEGDKLMEAMLQIRRGDAGQAAAGS